ncbi:MAG: WD40/YVTN/BNR-like repeat-containing protein [Candidatus Acidiferrales bacterium]
MRLARRNLGMVIGLLMVALFGTVGLFAQTLDTSLWSGMKWRSIGPFRGGRVETVVGIPGNPDVYYFGAVAGGVWKTTDAGRSWHPMFDKEPIASIGAIAIDPRDHNVVYVGTGEPCLRGNISFGNGMYKSLDGGHTWTHVGLDDTRHISKVLIDPQNPNTIFVAAIGHAYGPNEQRGVFRSTDAGKTWQKVLYKDDKTGAVDLVFDPANSHILYAALYQEIRTPWGFTSGGPGSGIYKSEDGGTTWKQLTGHGLPEGIYGRIGLAVGADSNRVYALIEAKKGGLYRSGDAGKTWHFVNGDQRFTQRAWYYMHIFADPKSSDTIYILNTGTYRSTDGGMHFSPVPAPHGDDHAFWIDPMDTRRLIEGNDGGATISVDDGKAWTAEDNQPTAQFYHVSVDNRFLYRVYGAQQDNSTVAIASRTDHGVITDRDWYDVGGGESGYIVADPKDPDIVYAGGNWGIITRLDRHTGLVQDVTVWPVNPSGWSAGQLPHRFQWTAPIAISPFNSNAVYIGGEKLFKTTDGGMNWTAISPDLTRNDKSKQGPSGGPITIDETSVEYYDTIFSVALSPVQRGLIWTGSDDGLVHITRDGGKIWSDVTPKGMPEWARIGLIAPSPYAAGTAYLAADRHRLDDFHPYVYKTTDYGKTWTAITEGLPQSGSYVHAVTADPVRKGLLYCGTETGIYVSFDDGAHWQSLELNMPVVPVTDMVVKNGDLVISTKGRSFWILDDLSPLRQANADVTSDAAHLFKPRVAWRTQLGHANPKSFAWYGQNAPDGAVIDYYLKTKPADKDKVTLEIVDSAGKVVRRYTNKKKKASDEQPSEAGNEFHSPKAIPVKAGMNRFVWDLRYESPTLIPGQVWDSADNPKGPLALPGEYQVRLTADGKTLTEPLIVKLDPRVKNTPEDLRKEFDLSLKIRDEITLADQTVNEMNSVKAQIKTLRKRLGSSAQNKPILDAADAVERKMKPINDQLWQGKMKASEEDLNYPDEINDQLKGIAEFMEGSDYAPTAADYAAYADLSGKADKLIAQWKEIKSKNLAALNEQIRKANIPAIAAMVPENSSE